MPSAWTRISQHVSRDTKQQKQDVDEALKFLKEMAQTLELYEHTSLEVLDRSTMSGVSKYSLAAEMLAKFKCWK